MRRQSCPRPDPAAARLSAHAGGWPLLAHRLVRSLRTTRNHLTAVVAVCRESRDPLFLGPAAVHLRQRLAALGAAARCTKPVPAFDAVAVPVVALVHLTLGQRQADGALESVVHWALESVVHGGA